MSDELREMSDYKVLMQFALRTRYGDQREEEFSVELLARLERGRKAEEALEEGRRLYAAAKDTVPIHNYPCSECDAKRDFLAWQRNILGGEKKEG